MRIASLKFQENSISSVNPGVKGKRVWQGRGWGSCDLKKGKRKKSCSNKKFIRLLYNLSLLLLYNFILETLDSLVLHDQGNLASGTLVRIRAAPYCFQTQDCLASEMNSLPPGARLFFILAE